MNSYHIPVLLNEVISYLNIHPGHWYVDANLGGGGHTEGILDKEGKVIGIDIDSEAINEVGQKHNLNIKTFDSHLEAYSPDLILYQDNFSNLESIISNISNRLISNSFDNKHYTKSPSSKNIIRINGVLFDLGVSTHQLEKASRGFSFNKNAPLDMRMNQLSEQTTAMDLINGLNQGELIELFFKLGEEHFAKMIARKIIEFRKIKAIETTDELANIILSVRPRSHIDRTHPATRVFQALRIAVNDELHSLKSALPQAFSLLSPGGRLVVISFHSLEDRIVKNFFIQEENMKRAKVLTEKPEEPTEEEIKQNPRSRSGKLRVLEKIS